MRNHCGGVPPDPSAETYEHPVRYVFRSDSLVIL
jgi:hypothetical protein